MGVETIQSWAFLFAYVAMTAMGAVVALRGQIERGKEQFGNLIARVSTLSRRLRRLAILLSAGLFCIVVPGLPSMVAAILYLFARYLERPNFGKIQAIANITDPDRFRAVLSRDPKLGRIFQQASRMIPEEAAQYLRASLPDDQQPLADIISLFLRDPSAHTLRVISNIAPIYGVAKRIENEIFLTKFGYYLLPILILGLEIFFRMDPGTEMLADSLMFVAFLIGTLIIGEF